MDSPVNAVYSITDFEHEIDKIDLHLIDAIFSNAGDHAFSFIDS